MYGRGEDIFYYLSVYNESFEQPTMPDGVEQGILNGLYPLDPKLTAKKRAGRPQLMGSGPILRETIRAQTILAEKFGVQADVWSITSFNELKRDAQSVARWNALHPDQKPRTSHLEDAVSGIKGPFIVSSENVQLVAEQLRPYMPGQYVVLGADGFGRSEARSTLRRHFEIDAECVAYYALLALSREGQFDPRKLPQALRELGIDPEKVDPAFA
jgi:pyruvate dehydrogenase E1 component